MRKFTCIKCGCHEYKRKGYKVHGKGNSDYRRKLSKSQPVSFQRFDSKVVCHKCGHAQRFKT